MKRVPSILLTGLIFSLLLSMIYVHGHAIPDNEPVKKVKTVSALTYHLPLIPTDINTINQLYPFNQMMVCRRPEQAHTNISDRKRYHFEQFITSGEVHSNKGWKKVEGNDIYKNGNSTLLIPQSFSVPEHSIFYPSQPTIIISGKD